MVVDSNLVPSVSLLPARLSLASGDGKKREPGNEVVLILVSEVMFVTSEVS